MKYSNEVIIKKPVAQVIELFDNPDNLKHWQKGLVSFEPLSGTPGQPGATSKLTFKNGGRTMEMIETITVRDLPREFSGTYDVKGVHNIQKNFFTEIDPDTTKYVSESEFQFKGPMKLLGVLMPGMFRKQSQKYLDDFKAFAEEGKSVLETETTG